MMSVTASKLLRPSVQRLVVNHGTRSMTVLSKESSEEYEKKVRRIDLRKMTFWILLRESFLLHWRRARSSAGYLLLKLTRI